MVKKYYKSVAAASLAVIFLIFSSACSQKVIKVDQNAGTGSAVKTEQKQVKEPAKLPPAGSEESLSTPLANSSTSFTILEGRSTGPMLPVYFDFDRSGIRLDQQNRIEKNAQYLKDNKNAKIVVEGNCDERGTNEYNMALGERRAVNAKKYLVNLGVDGQRINTISYGEEKPLNHGHDELAWSQNRRADFVQTK
ncbi:MAG: peptidoglycan-associated lipoprotein Pal [Deltaproteobacteria bacterium]|nr:peptidoglycan-associated lipoprotein Pal [Deltaproteobacteria bacterium]